MRPQCLGDGAAPAHAPAHAAAHPAQARAQGLRPRSGGTRALPDFTLERRAGGLVAGIDEVGRGPWAGPVVVAAVVLDRARLPREVARMIDDSKKLTALRREEALDRLRPYARVALAASSVGRIDATDILTATLDAMTRAIARLARRLDGALELALVDGNRAPVLDCPVETVVGGDARSLSIAAASIVAKVTRDRLMAALARRHPGYGWERNMGYGTAEHGAALARLGPCAHHRQSFAPVRAARERAPP